MKILALLAIAGHWQIDGKATQILKTLYFSNKNLMTMNSFFLAL